MFKALARAFGSLFRKRNPADWISNQRADAKAESDLIRMNDDR